MRRASFSDCIFSNASYRLNLSPCFNVMFSDRFFRLEYFRASLSSARPIDLVLFLLL